MSTQTSDQLIIVNFGHPLTPDQVTRILELTSFASARIIDTPAHFEEDVSFDVQTRSLIDATGLSPYDWQTAPIIVSLPSYSPIVATVLAFLHGCMGHFPTVLRFVRKPGALGSMYDVAEVLDLDHLRSQARRSR